MNKASLIALAGVALLAGYPAAQAKSYVYILTGQSNSLGAVKGSPASPEQLARYRSDALMWNGNMERDTGKCFEQSPAWQAVQPQLPSYGNLCMGPEYGFAYMMQKRGWHTRGGDDIRIIKASLDGGGNSFWLPGAAAWLSMTSSIRSAMAALPRDSKVQALLYLQGESDKGEEITRASERFLNLLANLGKKMKIKLKLAVVGECATWSGRETKDAKGSTTAAALYALSREKKNIGWVRTRDLSKITAGDSMGVHYDGKSQITIGARYAYAVAALENLPFTPTRGDDPQAPLDSPSAWWGSKKPGAEDVATWDVSSSGNGALAGHLSVAGIEVQDPFCGKVVIGSGGEHKAVLELGARGIRLEEGDLECAARTVKTVADQEWALAAGRKLSLGTAETPATLSGKGCITLSGAEDAVVELHLVAPPPHEWKLSSPAPHVEATIVGKPAQLREQGGVYKLVPAP